MTSTPTIIADDDRKIFISYRHGADSYAARQLHDRLSEIFGKERLMRDLAVSPKVIGRKTMPFFRKQVADCAVFIAVIGPGWLQARERLKEDTDPVRLEIEDALGRRGLRVISVRAGGVKMAEVSDALPSSLAKLQDYLGAELTDKHLDADIAEIAETIQDAGIPAIDDSPDPAPPRRTGWWATAGLVVIGAASYALWMLLSPSYPKTDAAFLAFDEALGAFEEMTKAKDEGEAR